METPYIRKTKFNVLLLTFVQINIYSEKMRSKFEAIQIGILLFITWNLRLR
jgi:hypothetical protein